MSLSPLCPCSDKRFARQYWNQRPPQFPMALLLPGIAHHLSGPAVNARTQSPVCMTGRSGGHCDTVVSWLGKQGGKRQSRHAPSLLSPRVDPSAFVRLRLPEGTSTRTKTLAPNAFVRTGLTLAFTADSLVRVSRRAVNHPDA